jgi:hypothetical protein
MPRVRPVLVPEKTWPAASISRLNVLPPPSAKISNRSVGGWKRQIIWPCQATTLPLAGSVTRPVVVLPLAP